MPKFRSYRADSIVLKHSDWGETDRILTLFTREHGKLRAVARGVRKIRSRRAGHLEPFTHVMLQLATSKDMPIVTQAETIESFQPLREDLLSIGQASYVVELLDRFTYPEGEHISLFRLLESSLKRLAGGEFDAALVLRYFELRLLDYTGFRPELFQCVICGEEIKPENQFFSAGRGGIVCPGCARRERDLERHGQNKAGVEHETGQFFKPLSAADRRPKHLGHLGPTALTPVSIDALRFIRHFQRSSFLTAARAAPGAGTHREMEILMQHYLTYVLERGLNTPKFIRKMRPD